MTHQPIGIRIARFRKAAGLTAQDLSAALERSEYGVRMSREVIANVESGRKSDVTVSELLAIAKVLDVVPAALAIESGDYQEVEWFCDTPAWYRPLRPREAAAILERDYSAMSHRDKYRYEQAIKMFEDEAEDVATLG